MPIVHTFGWTHEDKELSDAGLAKLRAVAVLADADGNEWDLDDMPEASMELGAMCSPRVVKLLVDEIRSLRVETERLAKAAAPGLASLDELTAEIGRQVDSGEFASGLVIEKDVVGRCVLAWAKHSMGDRVDGCRVLVTAPVAILLRTPEGTTPDPEG